MIRITLGALALLMTAGPQESTRIVALIQKLDSEDWVEQAQAAKELVRIGRPAMDPLGKVLSSSSPTAKFWASMIAESVMRGSSTAPAAALPPTAPETVPDANPRGFAPGENDMECYSCAVCKKAYQKSDLNCDKCGQSPAPRMGVRMKSHGM